LSQGLSRKLWWTRSQRWRLSCWAGRVRMRILDCASIRMLRTVPKLRIWRSARSAHRARCTLSAIGEASRLGSAGSRLQLRYCSATHACKSAGRLLRKSPVPLSNSLTNLARPAWRLTRRQRRRRPWRPRRRCGDLPDTNHSLLLHLLLPLELLLHLLLPLQIQGQGIGGESTPPSPTRAHRAAREDPLSRSTSCLTDGRHSPTMIPVQCTSATHHRVIRSGSCQSHLLSLRLVRVLHRLLMRRRKKVGRSPRG